MRFMVHIRHKVTKFFRRPEQMGVSQNGGAVSRLWAGLFPIKRRISYPAAYVFIFFSWKIRRHATFVIFVAWNIWGYNQGEDTSHLCTRKIDRFFSPPGASSLLKKVKVRIVRGGLTYRCFLLSEKFKERSPNPGVFVDVFFLLGGFSWWWSVVFLVLGFCS